MNVHSEITFIALVIVVALLCGMAMLRLKLPALVGYILAGVVLGPSGFGVVEDRDRINLQLFGQSPDTHTNIFQHS